MSQATAGDLETLQHGSARKVAGLAVVLVVALALATWFFAFKPGVGAPEQADKVLIVRVASSAGYSLALKRAGFDAAEGTLEHWAARAEDRFDLDAEQPAIAKVVRLADELGYGLVAFEQPQQVDFSPLGLDELPVFEDHVRFAVLSVGEFSSESPRMTVHSPVPPALRRAHVSLLDAVFAQPALAGVVPSEHSATMRAIGLRSKLSDAVADLDLITASNKLVTRIEDKLDAALSVEASDHGNSPRTLLARDRIGLAYPLGGGVLIDTKQYSLATRDGISAWLETGPKQAVWVRETQAASCTFLDVKGSLHRVEQVAADGGYAVVRTSDGTFVAKRTDNCAFVSSGKLPFHHQGVGHGNARAAKFELSDAWGVAIFTDSLRVFALDEARRSAVPAAIEFAGAEVVRASWIETAVLAVVLADARVVLLDAEQQRAGWLQAGTPISDIAPRTAGSVVATVVGGEADAVVRLDVDSTWSELLAHSVATGAAQPDASQLLELTWVDAGKQQTIEVATIAELTPRTLFEGGRIMDVAATVDGSKLAFAVAGADPAHGFDDGDDLEIAVVSAEGGLLQVVTRNTLRDDRPRFTADGELVFSTRVKVPHSRATVRIPRTTAARARSELR